MQTATLACLSGVQARPVALILTANCDCNASQRTARSWTVRHAPTPIWERGTGRMRDCLSWQSTILTWQGTSVHVTPGPVVRGTRASTPCAGLRPYRPSRALRFVRAQAPHSRPKGLIPNRRQGPYPLRTHAVRRVAHRIIFPLVHGLNGVDKAEPSEAGGAGSNPAGAPPAGALLRPRPSGSHDRWRLWASRARVDQSAPLAWSRA
jgi:hypothetical protein